MDMPQNSSNTKMSTKETPTSPNKIRCHYGREKDQNITNTEKHKKHEHGVSEATSISILR